MSDAITLREFIDELSKHEDLMDAKVISLGGGSSMKFGSFHLVHLKDYDKNGKNPIEKKIYIKCHKNA